LKEEFERSYDEVLLWEAQWGRGGWAQKPGEDSFMNVLFVAGVVMLAELQDGL